ncbi:MAG TPA: hypothetical protein VGO67_26580 [Verrucomicrobiae bacterium]|jgi:hypothetical protein
MSNAENFNFNLTTHAILAFLTATAFGGLCYFLAGTAARLYSQKPLQIYFLRLILFITLFVTLGAYWLFFLARALQGNRFDPNFWYFVARREGTYYGGFTVFGWLVVALINRPKARPAQKFVEGQS